MIFPEGLKTLLVERSIECFNCAKLLNIGDTMFEDNYRGDVFCGYCKEDYKQAIIEEEGEDGVKLK